MKKLICVLLVLMLPLPARGDAEIDLGLRIARVAANEGALVHRSEAALVWQTAREMGGGRSKSKIADWLMLHSPRVHQLRPCYSGNCLWTPYLSRSGAQPFGLTILAEVWGARVRSIWMDLLAYSDWLVAGFKSQDDPCRLQPRTWGGPMDREKAIKRGLYPIGCMSKCDYPSCNDGYTTLSRCWVDGVWMCDPTALPGGVR